MEGKRKKRRKEEDEMIKGESKDIWKMRVRKEVEEEEERVKESILDEGSSSSIFMNTEL